MLNCFDVMSVSPISGSVHSVLVATDIVSSFDVFNTSDFSTSIVTGISFVDVLKPKFSTSILTGIFSSLNVFKPSDFSTFMAALDAFSFVRAIGCGFAVSALAIFEVSFDNLTSGLG